MSFYRQVVAALSGLDKIPTRFDGSAASRALDAHYRLQPTDHYSKGQVVVAGEQTPVVDALSSQELDRCARQAVDDIRRLAR